jgi:hypothetical protein
VHLFQTAARGLIERLALLQAKGFGGRPIEKLLNTAGIDPPA